MKRREFLTLLGVGAVGPLLSRRNRAADAAERTPPRHRPNILFAIADDASFPHMGAYGCSWVKTPGFDRVARQGLLLRRAYTCNAKCAPSRASILTGRNSWQLEAACNHQPYFPAKFRTYPEALAESGYFVGKTGKGWAPGVPGTLNGKPRHLAGTPFEKRRAKPPTRGISNNDYAANFADFLDAAPPNKPWCFWYGCYEPHRGYEYGSGAAKGGMKTTDIPAVPATWPDNDTVRNDMLDYAFEIAHFDKHLVRMLDLLEKKGQLDNTLVIVTADNGMPFPRCKGQEYERSNHLPMAIMWKRGIRNPGRTVDDFVSFIDLAPTFIDVAGLTWKDTPMATSPGRTLTDIFAGARSGQVTPSRDHVLIGKERHDVGRPHDWGYPIRGIVKGHMLYLHNFKTDRWPAGNPETGYLNCDGSPTKTVILEGRDDPAKRKFWELSFGKRPADELYDIAKDPNCVTNLAERPDFASVMAAMRAQLFAELKAQQDPRMFGKGDVFDKYPYGSDRVRDFYTRYKKGEPVRAGWVNKSDFQKP
jgi:N-sulfoglucosamine sulfohydrolase